MNRVGVILLAAGQSLRLGEPKQLIDVDGEPLVRVIARRLLELCPATLCVVIGAGQSDVRAALHGLNVFIVESPRTNNGISTSIVPSCSITV